MTEPTPVTEDGEVIGLPPLPPDDQPMPAPPPPPPIMLPPGEPDDGSDSADL